MTSSPFTGPTEHRTAARNRYLAQMLERHDALVGRMPSTRDPLARMIPVLSVFLAVALGVLAVFVSQFILFQLDETPFSHLSTDVALIADFAFAIAVAFLLREALSLSAVKQMGAQFAGITLAMLTMHNVVHAIPEPLERLFSPEWGGACAGDNRAAFTAFSRTQLHLLNRAAQRHGAVATIRNKGAEMPSAFCTTQTFGRPNSVPFVADPLSERGAIPRYEEGDRDANGTETGLPRAYPAGARRADRIPSGRSIAAFRMWIRPRAKGSRASCGRKRPVAGVPRA